MNHLRSFVLASLVGALLVAAPATAAADVRLTPYVGFSDIYEDNKTTFGVSFGFGSLIGLEFDAARINLGSTETLEIVDLQAHATTYMGNFVVRLPTGPFQPYGSAGVGLVRVTGDVNVPIVGDVLSVSAQDVGWNIGGGAYIMPSSNFGIRVDVRRFRTGDVVFDEILDISGLDDLPLPDFNFWRTTVGLTLKF